MYRRYSKVIAFIDVVGIRYQSKRFEILVERSILAVIAAKLLYRSSKLFDIFKFGILFLNIRVVLRLELHFFKHILYESVEGHLLQRLFETDDKFSEYVYFFLRSRGHICVPYPLYHVEKRHIMLIGIFAKPFLNGVADTPFRQIYYSQYRLGIFRIRKHPKIRHGVFYFLSLIEFEAAVYLVRNTIHIHSFLERSRYTVDPDKYSEIIRSISVIVNEPDDLL